MEDNPERTLTVQVDRVLDIDEEKEQVEEEDPK
jgi:hypothetical protein